MTDITPVVDQKLRETTAKASQELDTMIDKLEQFRSKIESEDFEAIQPQGVEELHRIWGPLAGRLTEASAYADLKFKSAVGV